MSIRFLTPARHGVVDYLAAAGLLTLPFILGLGTSSPLAKWLAVATGVAVVVVSLLTDYRYGAVRVLPFKGHLAIDTAVAVGFLLAPTLFHFSGLDAWYYWANAIVVFIVVGLSQPTSKIMEPVPA
jgi:cation transport ATPase